MIPLEEVFSKVFRVPTQQITDASSNQTLRRWTSFKHVQLVVALEDTYAVKFTAAEIASFCSVAEARQLLRTKGAPV